MDHLNIDVKDQVRINKKPSKAAKPSDIEAVRAIMLKNKRNKVRKTKSKPPIKLILGCFTSLAILSVLHFYSHDILSFADSLSFRVSAVSKASAQADKKETNEAKVENEKKPPAQEKVAKKSEWTPEEIKIFKGLEKRKKILDEREANLNALSAELQRQKEILDEKLASIQKVRSDISRSLENEIVQDKEKVKKLVDVYSNMKPALAAKLFEEVDEKLAIEILGKMKKSNAANILNFIEAKKARRISEKYAGYIKK